MKIIEPSFQIIDPIDRMHGVDLLRKIEYMARISHRSEEKQTADSFDKFLRAVVIGHADWSVVEHASATVIFRIDRGLTHEIVRHRHTSVTQESTRFVSGRKSYPNGLEFIQPKEIQKPSPAYFSWLYSCEAAEKTYLDMLDWGTRPQEARSILPNSLASTIAITCNLRNWRHMFLLRTSRETHPDLRYIMISLLEQFQQLVPIIYEDIVPGARQIDNMEKAR